MSNLITKFEDRLDPNYYTLRRRHLRAYWDGVDEMHKRMDGWSRTSRVVVYLNVVYQTLPHLARIVNSPSIQQLTKALFYSAALYIGWVRLPGL